MVVGIQLALNRLLVLQTKPLILQRLRRHTCIIYKLTNNLAGLANHLLNI